MAQRFYPAVLERNAGDVFGVWFPDFPDCVAAGMTQETAIAKAQEALAVQVDQVLEEGHELPPPSPFEKIKTPKGCKLIALIAIGVDEREPSERVNVYLPKGLIARADRRATELGMSRSSFFGFALSFVLGKPVEAEIKASAMHRMRSASERPHRGK